MRGNPGTGAVNAGFRGQVMFLRGIVGMCYKNGCFRAARGMRQPVGPDFSPTDRGLFATRFRRNVLRRKLRLGAGAPRSGLTLSEHDASRASRSP